jgi:hypothetical protein
LHERTPPAKRCGGVTRAASFPSVHHLILIDIGDGAWRWWARAGPPISSKSGTGWVSSKKLIQRRPDLVGSSLGTAMVEEDGGSRRR